MGVRPVKRLGIFGVCLPLVFVAACATSGGGWSDSDTINMMNSFVPLMTQPAPQRRYSPPPQPVYRPVYQPSPAPVYPSGGSSDCDHAAWAAGGPACATR